MNTSMEDYQVDIRLVWDQIKPGLEVIKDRANADWRPEDVYALCVSGRATLYVIDDDFMVVQFTTNPFTLERELFILAAYGEGMTQDKHLPDILNLAVAKGCAYVEMLSPRTGFERTGWGTKNICYRRRV